jgi:hypothetical protein
MSELIAWIFPIVGFSIVAIVIGLFGSKLYHLLVSIVGGTATPAVLVQGVFEGPSGKCVPGAPTLSCGNAKTQTTDEGYCNGYDDE